MLTATDSQEKLRFLRNSSMLKPFFVGMSGISKYCKEALKPKTKINRDKLPG